MRKLGAVVVIGATLFPTFMVHAAPPSPTPAPTSTPAPSSPAPSSPRLNPGRLPQGKVEATVLATINKCGEPTKARVTLQNKTSQPWAGVINFVHLLAGGTNTSVSLAAAGQPDAMKTIDVVGPKLDCSKPLGLQGIRVWKNLETSSPLLVQSLKPTTVSAFRDLSGSAPPSSEAKVWLRRVTFDATCGGNVTATAMLHSFGQQSQEGKTKLAFGVHVKEATVEVRGNTPVPYTAPLSLDCNATSGLPPFDYALLSGLGATGQLSAYEVTFEPSP